MKGSYEMIVRQCREIICKRGRNCDSALTEQFQGERIGLAGEVLVEGLGEVGGLRNGAGEERHGRAELEVVGVAEDPLDGSFLDLVHKDCALFKARAEDGMAPVGRGFLKRADAVKVGVGAGAEPLHLRKDEPDPMALLLAGAEFDQNLRIDAGLGAEKSVEIEGVIHMLFKLALASHSSHPCLESKSDSLMGHSQFRTTRGRLEPGLACDSAGEQPGDQRHGKRHGNPAGLLQRALEGRGDMHWSKCN